jgi:hypothetical protein
VAAMFDTVTSPSGGWMNYRKQLAPYLDGLRPFARQFGYTDA